MKKSADTISSRWFFRKVFQVCDGGLGTVRSNRDTVRSEIPIPSILSSPWIHGARHNGLAAATAAQQPQEPKQKQKDGCHGLDYFPATMPPSGRDRFLANDTHILAIRAARLVCARTLPTNFVLTDAEVSVTITAVQNRAGL